MGHDVPKDSESHYQACGQRRALSAGAFKYTFVSPLNPLAVHRAWEQTLQAAPLLRVDLLHVCERYVGQVKCKNVLRTESGRIGKGGEEVALGRSKQHFVWYGRFGDSKMTQNGGQRIANMTQERSGASFVSLVRWRGSCASADAADFRGRRLVMCARGIKVAERGLELAAGGLVLEWFVRVSSGHRIHANTGVDCDRHAVPMVDTATVGVICHVGGRRLHVPCRVERLGGELERDGLAALQVANKGRRDDDLLLEESP